MLHFVLLSCLLSFAFTEAVSARRQCLSTGSYLYTLMSTMTPYDDVKGYIKKYEDCKPQGLWAFIRHGTRFPHKDEMARYQNLSSLRDQIIENHQKSKGELCKEDQDALCQWELVADPQQEMLLTASGIDELVKFGSRTRYPFNNLLYPYTSDKVDIRITSLERTRQSAESFLRGVYNKPMKIPHSMVYDSLLKNEMNCSAWKASTRNVQLEKQVALFKNSREVEHLLKSVSKRLGLEAELDFDKVKDIYDVCTFEYAWYHDSKNTPWCAAFSTEELKIMEYHEDLVYFYKSAYGNDLTKKLGCSLVKDMVDRLESGAFKSTLYFGHSLGIRKLLTSLGIGEDTMLSGDSYKNSDDRNWRTSYYTPFSANLIGVKYECKKGAHGMRETSRLAFFVNEKVVRLPACGGREMCGLEEFKRVFTQLINPLFCNRDFCSS